VKYGEHRPPKPKTAAKAKAKADCTGTRVREDPNEAAKRELAGLLDEAKKP